MLLRYCFICVHFCDSLSRMGVAAAELHHLLAADGVLERIFLLMAQPSGIFEAGALIKPIPGAFLRAVAYHMSKRDVAFDSHLVSAMLCSISGLKKKKKKK